MVEIITVSNFKGGVGKSTFTELFAYLLSTKYGKSVLVIDLDPQETVSDKLKRTFHKSDVEPQKKLLNSLMENTITESLIHLNENLDLINGDWDMEQFDEFITSTQSDEARYYYIYTVLDEIKNNYDYILLDTRPSTGLSTQNAICTSDYVIIPTNTEDSSVKSAKKLYSNIASLVPYNENIRLLGVLPYLENPRGSTSIKIKEELKEIFEEDLYENTIRYSDRVVTWGKYGVTEDKPHDQRTLHMYDLVCIETMERMKRLEA